MSEPKEKSTQTSESLTDCCKTADKTMRSARKTKDLTTRLNANRCLILSRYFKFLNAACPNEVVNIWKTIVNNASVLQTELKEAEKLAEIEASTFVEKSKRSEDLSAKLINDDADEEEEEDDHD